MAFYPDELSPIDPIHNIGKSTDLPEINLLKNRRQWKSLVLGKKDMGMNNFATIAEEKEEEISSDGSHGRNSNIGSASSLNSGVVVNRKITFAKPRKYITSRVSDRKEDDSLKVTSPNSPTQSPDSSPHKDAFLGVEKKKFPVNELFNSSTSSGLNVPEVTKQLLKAKQSRELITPRQEFVENFILDETPVDTQWNEAVTEAGLLSHWQKSGTEKASPVKQDSVQSVKSKEDHKKKSAGKSPTSGKRQESPQKELKGKKKKVVSPPKKKSALLKAEEETPAPTSPEKAGPSKGKQKADSGKSLNMKDVVNVYKNLAYGSKEEIKSFVENLPFVKDESKTENDKNLKSVMNLKALENKIKNFTKKYTKAQEGTGSSGKTTKAGKSIKKNRKAHIERLARHKVVKVPAELSYNQLQNTVAPLGESKRKSLEQKKKVPPAEEKEPWKYVGMQSALDKTYFVYPAYPPSITLKKSLRKGKGGAGGKKAAGKECEATPQKEEKEKPGNVSVAKTTATGSKVTKVKGQEIMIRQNLITKGNLKEKVRSGVAPTANALNVSRSLSNKSMNRSSATTVCTVEFRSAGAGKTQNVFPAEETDGTDPSLLVYLHGTKALNVKTPYADKQFSRVKFFRKDGREMPLIKGLSPKVLPKGYGNVSVRNVSLPEKLSSPRSLDLLDFDEDIRQITEFLHLQNSSSRGQQEEMQKLKRDGRNRAGRNAPKETDLRRQPHQNRTLHTQLNRPQNQTHPHIHPKDLRGLHNPYELQEQHQHGTAQEILSPDSIINEISKNIQHLQYLPDTVENRKVIAQFFDELDRRIEASKGELPTLQKFPSLTQMYMPFPILGY